MGTAIHAVVKIIKDNATLTNATTTTVTLTRPNGTEVQDIYRDVNLLADKAEIGYRYMAGLLTVGLSWSNANILVRTVQKEKVDHTWDTIFNDATGIATNDTTMLPYIMSNIPLDGNESVRIVFYNGTGGGVAGFTLGRYTIGLPWDSKTISTP